MNASGIAAASAKDRLGRHPHRFPRMHHHVLGVGAATHETEDAVAQRELGDVLAQRVDLAGVLETRDVLRRSGRRRVGAHALEQIGAIDRGRAHADAHLARAKETGDRHLAKVEDLGPAELRMTMAFRCVLLRGVDDEREAEPEADERLGRRVERRADPRSAR